MRNDDDMEEKEEMKGMKRVKEIIKMNEYWRNQEENEMGKYIGCTLNACN